MWVNVSTLEDGARGRREKMEVLDVVVKGEGRGGRRVAVEKRRRPGNAEHSIGAAAYEAQRC